MQKKEQSKQQFIISSLLKAIGSFALILLFFLLLKQFPSEKYLAFLAPLTSRPIAMYAVFLFSEAVIGLLPPDFFMMWALGKGVDSFIETVIILSILSYVGGFGAFWFGYLCQKTKFIQNFLRKKKVKKYLEYYRRFGGVIIIIAAVTPVPFALISTLSGALNYRFSFYVKYAVFRILRFVVYGWVIWEVNAI